MIKRGINYEGLCIKVDAAGSSSSHGLGGFTGSLNHQSQLASGHQQQQLQAQPRKRIDFKLPPSVAEQPQPWHHQPASTASTAASASSRFSLSGGGGGGGGSGGHGGPPVEANPTSSATTTSSHTNTTVSQASSHSQPNETKNISISSQPPSSSIPLLPLVPSCLSSLTASDDKEEPTISTASEDNGGLSKKE